MPLVFRSRFLKLRRMLPRFLFPWALLACVAAPAAHAQVEIANLREDVRGLTQRVGELALRLEQLERENAALRQSSSGLSQTYVTLNQLNTAILDLNSNIRTAVNASKNEVLQQVAVQSEKLAKQSAAATEDAKNTAARPTVQAAFSEDYPKEGVSYTVQKNDNLGSIAKKFGAKQQDIINANKLADPSRIVIGQQLFIPGGK
jgi:LysM repeat protein